MERISGFHNENYDKEASLLLARSKSGLPTAICGGRYLHSSYDPEKEAERFSRSAGSLPQGSVVVLLGEALGYLSRRLIKDNPGIRLLTVYCCAYFYNNRPAFDEEPALRAGEVFSWRPGAAQNFGAFLRRHISDTDFSALKVLEWEPSREAFPLLMARLKEELSRFGRQVNGSLFTTAAFGKKWITNSIRNYLALEEALVPRRIEGPVCIAASGPSLAEALPFLERHRRAFTLFALPSALDFLSRSGFTPELVILTDPGFYTNLHFRASFRRESSGGSFAKLCMPLTACAGLAGRGGASALFHQGTPPETALLEDLKPAPIQIPSNGTVTGTALQLAFCLGAQPLILLGMDMAARGIEEHARPNAFDEYYTQKDCRLRPEESWRALRIFGMYPDRLCGAWRTSPSLRPYSGWFSSRAEAWAGRVFRMSASPVETGCLSSYAEAEKLLGQSPFLTYEKLRLPPLRERRERAAAFIETLRRSFPSGGASQEAEEILLMADTAGVLELKKNPRDSLAAESLRRTIEEFSAFLYAIVGAAV
jgi:hypothetical protein